MPRFRAVLCAAVLAQGCGSASSGGPGSDGGLADGGSDGGATLRAAFTSGELKAALRPRVSPAGLRVIADGPRTIALSISRDTAGRVSRRLSVHAAGTEIWSVEEGPSERFTDVAVHPSGDLSLGVERLDAERDAFDLVRLDRAGQVWRRQRLPRPTFPEGDLAGGVDPSVFAMKGVMASSVVSGWLPWLALQANGEDLVVALLSYAERPEGLSDTAVVSAVLSLTWAPGGYSERWSRLVDRPHALVAVAWQYDEFLWLDAASRLLASVGPSGVVVGRTVTSGRCLSLQAYGEQTAAQCRTMGGRGSPHRYQPFGWTRFTPSGSRLGSAVVAPPDTEELVVFDMAVRGEEIALAGTTVLLGPEGTPDYYFEPPEATETTPMSPYDGYLAIAGLVSGEIRWSRVIDRGRGEFFASLRWTDEGLVAAGASDWNRWYGGMSVSRGADPLLVLAPLDGSAVLQRTLPVEPDDRHAYLRSIDVQNGAVVGVGPADAPMTHSGDVEIAPMALGGLDLRLP